MEKIEARVVFDDWLEEQLSVWIVLNKSLKTTKNDEATLRRAICDFVFGEKTGEFRVKFSNEHFKGTAVSKVGISVDEALLTALNEEEEFTPEEAACFDWKIKIKEGNLKKLPKTSRVWKAITTKPAMPTLEVERCDE